MASLSRRRFLTGRLDCGSAQVAVIGPSCLALRGVFCQNCRDACEPRAVRFDPVRGGVARPIVDLAACTGCGACIAMCPCAAITLERAAT